MWKNGVCKPWRVVLSKARREAKRGRSAVGVSGRGWECPERSGTMAILWITTHRLAMGCPSIEVKKSQGWWLIDSIRTQLPSTSSIPCVPNAKKLVRDRDRDLVPIIYLCAAQIPTTVAKIKRGLSSRSVSVNRVNPKSTYSIFEQRADK
jgi:hypothetical protein